MTTRYISNTGVQVETPRIDAFLEEVNQLCRVYGFCITHEDTHGGFIISNYDDERDFEWLNSASIDRTIPDDRR